jgi:membrane AbrB-like protein
MKWALFVVASIAVAAGAQALRVPAAWLIGPMVVAIAMTTTGFRGRLPRQTFTVSQALIAVTVAQTITAPIAIELAHQWMPILAAVLLSVAAGGIAGWALARYSPIPAETAAWGSTPGGATTMTILAADFGADARLVAFMQYLRVTLVVLSASAVSRLLLGHAPSLSHQASSSGPFDPPAFAITLAFALVAGLAGKYSRLPGGQFLVPMLVAGIFHATGFFHPYMPWWLLDAAYLGVGWSIGLLYTRETLLFALRMLPTLALSTLLLVALCAATSIILVVFVGADPMTAYLATTPGGLDSVPIIGLDAGGNLPLILAVQTTRVFAVIATGPPLAKLIARIAPRSELAARVGERGEHDQRGGFGAQDARAE